MISQKLADAINHQLNLEFQSFYLYLSMSAYCEAENFKGFAHWVRVQSDEEYAHATRLFDLLNQLGAAVALGAIPEPEATYDSLRTMFKAILEHEQRVTERINDLYALCVEERAFPAQTVVQWFVDEQVEEVNTAVEIVHKLELIQDDGVGLLALDRELAARPPAAAAAAPAP